MKFTEAHAKWYAFTAPVLNAEQIVEAKVNLSFIENFRETWETCGRIEAVMSAIVHAMSDEQKEKFANVLGYVKHD